MKEQPRFWFVHARVDGKPVHLAVAAFTALSARRQARRTLGPKQAIEGVAPVNYAHAWVIDIGWSYRRYAPPEAADAVARPDGESTD